jgi:hypothetical protein
MQWHDRGVNAVLEELETNRNGLTSADAEGSSRNTASTGSRRRAAGTFL